MRELSLPPIKMETMDWRDPDDYNDEICKPEDEVFGD